MLVAIGGHSRSVGKTSVATALIRALPEAGWTAVKISHHGGAGEPALLNEETDRDAESDSALYLVAGARRAWCLRVAADGLEAELPALRVILTQTPNALIESNRILEFFRPDLYLLVLDPEVAEFKGGARRFLDRADAFVFIGGGPVPAAWGIPAELFQARPCFRVERGRWTDPGLVDWVRSRFFVREAARAPHTTTVRER